MPLIPFNSVGGYAIGFTASTVIDSSGNVFASGLSAAGATFAGNLNFRNTSDQNFITSKAANGIVIEDGSAGSNAFILMNSGSGTRIDNVLLPIIIGDTNDSFNSTFISVDDFNSAILINSATGAVELYGGSGVNITGFGNPIILSSNNGIQMYGGISASGGITFNGNISAPNIVNSINGKTGAINLVAGSGITLALSGNTFTISSTTTSGGGTYYNFTQSSSAPAGPTAGDRWFDTNTGKFFTAITDSGNNIWIESGGVGSGQAGLTASIDFSETINYLKLRVTGLGTDFSTPLSIFDTQVQFFETVSISTISFSNVITITQIVEYDPKFINGQWVVDITAKPPFGNNLTAEQLTNQTFTELYVAWNLSGLGLIEDYWNNITNVEILEKQATYVIKGITGQSWVAADSFITCKVMGLTSADHTAEDAILEGVQFDINNINPGVGFDIIGHAPNGTYGKYTIKCLGQ